MKKRTLIFAALALLLISPMAFTEEMGSAGMRAVIGQMASLIRQNQILQGGATTTDVCSLDGTPFASTSCQGSFTVNCGLGPNQGWNNNGAATIAAPKFSGGCDIWIINGASAATPTFSGFTVGTNTGDSLNTTSGNKFVLWIGSFNGVASYQIKALQ